MNGLGAISGHHLIRDTPPAALPFEPITVTVDGEAPPAKTNKDGSVSLELDDGSVLIDFNPQPKRDPANEKFGDNLAITFGGSIMDGIATELLTEIEDDINSRSEWLETREKGLRLLGLRIEEPRGDTGSSTAPVEGMSTMHSSMLLDACLRFQANARGELLPAAGPVKIQDNAGQQSGARDELADLLEKDMNVYLTQDAPEYYPDTDRMLLYVGFGGTGFKKVYNCALRRRPVSESVDASDMIVNAGATDLRNARRITHRIKMRDSMVKRMQIAGAYRDVDLTQAQYQADAVAETAGQIEGVNAQPQLPQDQDRTIYEVLCERDLGEHDDHLPLPYKITIDKDSREILEIRRNWEENDPMYMPKCMYVRWPYVEAFGIYGIGLLQILGNLTKGLTAAIRLMLDAGMFASFPGFLYSDAIARQETNDFRIPPGGGMKIQTGGAPISEVVMKLPYDGPSPALMQLAQTLDDMGRKMSGSAELPTGEGVQNAPVGTVMAIIDQATKVIDAVHKRLHAAQAEEFRLLKARFQEDPEAFWRHSPKDNWDKETFLNALNDFDLVPVSDPNTPTHTHRLMKTAALVQLAGQYPQQFKAQAVSEHALRALGFSDPSEFLNDATTAAAMPNPQLMDAQSRQAEAQAKTQEVQARAQGDAAKNKLEYTRILLENRLRTQEAQNKARYESGRLALENKRFGMDVVTEPHVAHAIDATHGLAGLGQPQPEPTAPAGPLQ